MSHAGEPTFQNGSEISNVISHQRKLDWELAPVKDINALVEEVNKDSTPLNYLSEEAKQRFIESIEFNENGIGGFYYADLESELTPTQIHKVLSLFGAQKLVPMLKRSRIETKADLLLLQSSVSNLSSGPSGSPGTFNAECVAHHTCAFKAGSICTEEC